MEGWIDLPHSEKEDKKPSVIVGQFSEAGAPLRLQLRGGKKIPATPKVQILLTLIFKIH